MDETIKGKEAYLSKNEFAELIQHLDMKEILCVEFYANNRWNYLFEVSRFNRPVFVCNLCRARIGSQMNLRSHIDGRKHKILLQDISYLYHAEYTYPKPSSTLPNGKATTNAQNVEENTLQQNCSNANANSAAVANLNTDSNCSNPKSTVISNESTQNANNDENPAVTVDERIVIEKVPIKIEPVAETVEINSSNDNTPTKESIIPMCNSNPIEANKVSKGLEESQATNLNSNFGSDVGINTNSATGDLNGETLKAKSVANRNRDLSRNRRNASAVRAAKKRPYPPINRNSNEIVNTKFLRPNEGDNAVKETGREIRTESKECRGALGVEYIIKIMKDTDDESSRCECILCHLLLAGRLMQQHLESYNHRLNYCEKHFPKTINYYRNCLSGLPDYDIYKVLSPILTKLSIAIEEYYGLSSPSIVLESDYTICRRKSIIMRMKTGEHASELCGPNFTQIISPEEIECIKQKAFDATPPVSASANLGFDKAIETIDNTKPPTYAYEEPNRKRSYDDEYKGNKQRKPYDRSRIDENQSNVVMNTNLSIQHNDAYPIQCETPSSSRQVNNPHITNSVSSEPSRANHTLWQEYCNKVDNEMDALDDSYKSYWQDPETHPRYNNEWKAFWKLRKNQLIAEGIDYKTYNFQLEWIKFFKTRIKEFYYEDSNNIKYKVLMQLGLPKTNEFLPESKYHIDFNRLNPPTTQATNAITLNEQQLQHQQQQQQERASPQLVAEMKEIFNENKSQVVSVLRIMAALEDHLGSLGPKIINLLSKALQIEKTNPIQVNFLLLNEENCCTIETAKEKFKGVVLAGFFEGSKQRALIKAIASAESLLTYAEKIQKENADTSAEQGTFMKPTTSTGRSPGSNPQFSNAPLQTNQSNLLPPMLASQNANMHMGLVQHQQLAAAAAYERNQTDMRNKQQASSSNIDPKQFNMNPLNTNAISQVCDSTLNTSDSQLYTQSILSPYPAVPYANKYQFNANECYNNTNNLANNMTSITGNMNSCNAITEANNNQNNYPNHTFNNKPMRNNTNKFAKRMRNPNRSYNVRQRNRNSKYAKRAGQCNDQSLQANSSANDNYSFRVAGRPRRIKVPKFKGVVAGKSKKNASRRGK